MQVLPAPQFGEVTAATTWEAGIAVYWGDQLISLITIRTDGQRILDVYSILNPDKLHGLK